MKRVFGYCAFIAALLMMSLPLCVHAQSIQNFISKISILPSGELQVMEEITYDFGSEQRHGIFRNISRTSQNGPLIQVQVVSVRDEHDISYRFTESQSDDTLQIKIGDPAQFVTGIKTYIISYRVENVIRAFDDHEELFWNVTGNEWDVPISSAETFITTPVDRNIELQMTCYTGAYGSKDQNCTYGNNDGIKQFSTTKALQSGEGLTIVLGMPVGTVTYTATGTPERAPTIPVWGRIILFLSTFISWGAVPLMIIAIIRRLAKRKPKPIIPWKLKNKPVVVQYDPPNGLLPIEVGTLIDRKVDLTDISSVIVHLAVRGYLKIKYLDEVIAYFPKRHDFELIKMKDGSDLIHSADVAVFNLLFKNRDSVRLSDLKKTAHKTQKFIKDVSEATENGIAEKGLFNPKQKKEHRQSLIAAMVAFCVILFVYMFITQGADIFSVIHAIFIVIIVGFFFIKLFSRSLSLLLRNKLTDTGTETLGKILGFMDFLKLTETDKLRLTQVPELRPELFEKFLPYAMVLGIEEKWAKQFEKIYTAIPGWYEDPNMVGFNTNAFALSLGTFGMSMNGSLGFSTSGYSSGFSGGGGGGFSGGGSGGGGGGSW